MMFLNYHISIIISKDICQTLQACYILRLTALKHQLETVVLLVERGWTHAKNSLAIPANRELAASCWAIISPPSLGATREVGCLGAIIMGCQTPGIIS